MLPVSHEQFMFVFWNTTLQCCMQLQETRTGLLNTILLIQQGEKKLEKDCLVMRMSLCPIIWHMSPLLDHSIMTSRPVLNVCRRIT